MIKIRLKSNYNSELEKRYNRGYKDGYMDSTYLNKQRISKHKETIKDSENKLKNTVLELEECKKHIRHQSDTIDSLNLILFNTNSILNGYRDSEIEYLTAIMKKCKKARVKTKYRNKILKVVTQKLIKKGAISE